MPRLLPFILIVTMCFGRLCSEKTNDAFCNACRCQTSSVICEEIGQLNFLQKYKGRNVRSLIITGGIQEEENEYQFEKFRTISELYLQFGNLQDNPHIFGLLSDVMLLDLRNNSLTKVDSEMFVNNKMLISLDLRDNKISDIESFAFENLKELTMLILRGNKLETLKDNTFAGLSALTLLDLSRNKLSSVTVALLAPLESLEELRLEGNALSAIGSDLARQLARPGLEATLGANPFVCTCDSLGAAFTTYKSYTAVTGTVLDIFCDGDDNKPWVTVMSTLDCASTVNNGKDKIDAGDEKASSKPEVSTSVPDNTFSDKVSVSTKKFDENYFMNTSYNVPENKGVESSGRVSVLSSGQEAASEAVVRYSKNEGRSNNLEEYAASKMLSEKQQLRYKGRKPANPTSEDEDDAALYKRFVPNPVPSSEDEPQQFELPVNWNDDSTAKFAKQTNLVHDDVMNLEKEYSIEAVIFIFLVCVAAIVSTLLAAVMIVLYSRKMK